MNQAIRDRFYSQGNKKHVEMLEKWDEAHRHYVEKAAWIKTMLAM